MSECSLVFGFDSAWTAHNQGAVVGALLRPSHSPELLDPPRVADFKEAWDYITGLQEQHQPERTYIFIDQPTIVPNDTGQRPVEHLVAGPKVAASEGPTLESEAHRHVL